MDCFYKIYLIVSKYCNMTQIKYYSVVPLARLLQKAKLKCITQNCEISNDNLLIQAHIIFLKIRSLMAYFSSVFESGVGTDTCRSPKDTYQGTHK
jgi:hypothetical protein